MRTTLFAIVMFLLLLASAGVAAYVWREIGDVDIGMHGTIALVAGVLASLVVGVGLMSLVFISSRRGVDDDAGR